GQLATAEGAAASTGRYPRAGRTSGRPGHRARRRARRWRRARTAGRRASEEHLEPAAEASECTGGHLVADEEMQVDARARRPPGGAVCLGAPLVERRAVPVLRAVHPHVACFEDPLLAGRPDRAQPGSQVRARYLVARAGIESARPFPPTERDGAEREARQDLCEEIGASVGEPAAQRGFRALRGARRVQAPRTEPQPGREPALRPAQVRLHVAALIRSSWLLLRRPVALA